MRRIAAVAAAAVALTSIAGLAACGNPQQSVRHCQGAPEESVLAIQQKLTADGKLRNGKLVHLRGGPYFVSAEIHLEDDDAHDKGDIATWATDDIESTDAFQSVDVHAREESTWPDVDARRHRRRRHRVTSMRRAQHRQDQGTDPVRAGRGVR